MPARRVVGLLAPLLACVALFAVIEVAVRALVPCYASRDFFLTLFGDPPDGTPPTQKPLFEGDAQLFWRLRPNVQTIWDFTVVSTNEQGLRHDGPIGPKRPGTLRIVCVGDSVTFGYRIPLVFPDAPDQYDRTDAPYPRRMERLLRARFPGRDIEVIGLAVPGYSTHQGRLLLERWIARLDPDVVILCFGFNDVALKHWPDKVVMSRSAFDTALRAVMSSSQALLHAWRWWTSRPDRAPQPLPEPQPRVSAEDYLNNLIAMTELAEQHGARVLVVGPVYRDPVTVPPEAVRIGHYRSLLREAMRRLGVPYVQIDELTEASYPANKELFGEHIHPSSTGHQLMAERIAEALVANHLLDEPEAGSGT